MQILFLLDHDNIRHGKVDVRDILASWIDGTPELPSVIFADVRAYGGWFQKECTTQARYEAAEKYQRLCPSVLRHRGRLCKVTFQFADKLLPLPTEATASHPNITHTVASRSSAQYSRARITAAECLEVACELNTVRRWVKNKSACTRAACPRSFEEVFERTEQKQVDIHIAVDLLRAVMHRSYEHVVLASDDWDFLPALLAAAYDGRAGVSLLRSNESTTYLDANLTTAGVRIIQLRQTSLELI